MSQIEPNTPATVPDQPEAESPVRKSKPIVLALVAIVALIGIANVSSLVSGNKKSAPASALTVRPSTANAQQVSSFETQQQQEVRHDAEQRQRQQELATALQQLQTAQGVPGPEADNAVPMTGAQRQAIYGNSPDAPAHTSNVSQAQAEAKQTHQRDRAFGQAQGRSRDSTAIHQRISKGVVIMATQWGRKETIIWPPHVPMLSYAAVATALLCTCLFVWQRFAFSMTPLQRSYMTEYIRSQVGATFNAHEGYRLLYLGGGKSKPRLAFPVDFVPGKTALPDGRIMPVALSELASLQGYRWFYRGPERKLPDVSLHRWLRETVYEHEGLVRMFAVALIEGAVCLVAMLWFAVPRDIKRFKQLKYGRILRGPRLLLPEEFNKQQKGDGIGFKTTELGKMMRIPLRKEAHHFQIMGDTGVGKTQLIMQILRQIRERRDSAIIYDPAGEYLQRFYDPERGDIVLNPLDERCPYWGPAQEMASNAEADAIAASLYQPTTDVKDEFFHQTPAQIFAHLLRKGPTPHQLAEWMASSDTLERLVAGTEMSFYIDRKAGAQRAGVLASLGLVAKCFRLLPEKNQTDRTWNARTWAKERKGWIFITSRPPERETLRPLHSLWIDLLVMRLLSAPQPGQKPVWFVIDELASLHKLPQLHTAITENRKSKNPLVLGFQGKAQLEVIYGHLAEVMLSQPATKIFMKTAEPKAAEWISEAIGKVEIERLKETKFDGSRSGKNFTVDRQIEPLVMGSEISGLDDRHAYLKLGNNVAQFDFDYLDLPTPTPAFVPRQSADGEMSFDPDTLQLRRPHTPVTEVTQPISETEVQAGSGAPLAHKIASQPSQQPEQNEQQLTQTLAEEQVLDAATEHETVVRQQYELGLQIPSDEPHHEVHSGIF